MLLNHIPLTISSAYCAPSQKIKANDFIHCFNSLGNNFLSGSHFNSKHTTWGSRITNTRGRALHNFISNNNL